MRVPSKMLEDDYDNDFEVDVSFGLWLKERRSRSCYHLKDAAQITCISEDRLDALEQGEAERGINYEEAEKLSRLYGVDIRAILQRAVSG